MSAPRACSTPSTNLSDPRRVKTRRSGADRSDVSSEPELEAEGTLAPEAAEGDPAADPQDSGTRKATRDEATRRCSGCGGPLAHDVSVCTFCGAAVEGALSQICRECFAQNEEDARFCAACGCGMGSQSPIGDGHPLPCPCCEQSMPARRIGSFPANECENCNGLWIPGDQFDALVEAAAKARQENQTEQVEPDPRHTGANPVAQAIAYRRCPECDAMMQRKNFRQRSGVILDVCRDHGTWLDSDELERVVGFIMSGGLEGIPEPEPSQQSYAVGEFTRIIAEEQQGIFSDRHRQESSTLRQILRTLGELLVR